MFKVPTILAGVFGRGQLHQDAQLLQFVPLRAKTPAAQWSYAISWSPECDRHDSPAAALREARLGLHIDVISGRIGVGWTNESGDAFVEERFLQGGDVQVRLPMPARSAVGRLVIRNVRSDGASEFVIRDARLEPPSPYPVSLSMRSVMDEPAPEGGTAVFDTEDAARINSARLDWLRDVQLPVEGRRVLDAGAGVGHFIPFYRQRQCSVVALDGRAGNVAELRRRHPDVEAHVADVQTLTPAALGVFDIIHCFGLLYHLDSPMAALRNFRQMCRWLLILETMVCDSPHPVLVLADETRAASQALVGVGSRPSPAYVVLALNRVGFPFVYGAASPPQHPDFHFRWRSNLETVRDGHALRCIFVAADHRLDNPRLISLLD